MVMGLAFGVGLLANVGDAYRYLMNVFEVGDRVFLFGFSRGAYTARALVDAHLSSGRWVQGNILPPLPIAPCGSMGHGEFCWVDLGSPETPIYGAEPRYGQRTPCSFNR